MNHWTFIEDSFFLNDRGLVVAIYLPCGFEYNIRDAVTVFAPNGNVFTTYISGFSNHISVHDEIKRASIGLKGFNSNPHMVGWLMVVHSNGLETD